jgi:hypothetical protein
MIKKAISLFFISLLFCLKIYAVDINLGYNYGKTNGIVKYLKECEIKYQEKEKNFNWLINFKIKDTELGDSLFMETQLSKDLDDTWDIWGALVYKDDDILDIKSRIDSKIGFGCYLIKQKKLFSSRKIKFSYGLIYRDEHLLHSVRLKDEYRLTGIGYKLIFNYILPNGNKHFDELSINFIPGLKILNFQPSFSYEYIKTYERDLFETKFSLGIKI